MNLASGTGSGQLKAAHSGMCLATPVGDNTDAVAIRQQPCGSGAEQIWDAVGMAGGFKLVNRANGKCMNLYGGLNADGTAVNQYTCGGGANEAWSARAQNGGYALVSASSGKCLDVYGVSMAAGTQLIHWPCHGGANQTFSSPATVSVNLFGGTGSGQLKAAHSGMCLATPVGDNTDAVAIRQQPCGSGAEQIWDAVGMAGGFKLVNRANGKCMNLYGGLNADGTAVNQYTCGGGANEAWSARAQNGGYALVSASSGKCLDVYGVSMAAGTQAIQWTCLGSANQTFSSPAMVNLNLVGGTGSGQLKAAHSGMCLATPVGDNTDAVAIRQQPCGSGAEQIWDAVGMAGGFKLVNRANGKCMNLYGGLNADGTAINQYTCGGSANEAWSARPQSGGFSLVSASSGKCLDVYGVSMAAGTQVIQWTCLGSANQIFSSPPGSGGTVTGGTVDGSVSSGGSVYTAASEQAPGGSLMLILRYSGKCLQVPGGQAGDGAKLNLTTCTNQSPQLWSFVSAGNQGYQVRNVSSGACLWVDRGYTDNTPSLIQQSCNSGMAGGFWKLRKLDQWYELVAAHSSRCATIENNSREEGAGLMQYDCLGDDSQRFTLAAGPVTAAWTPLRTIGIVPVSAAALPSGKLLMWGGETRNTFGSSTNMWTTLYDPSNDSAAESYVSNAGEAFCPGTSILADGRILTNGGSNADRTIIYDPSSNSWSTGQSMNIQRGYSGNTTLSTGEALTYGGSWSGNYDSDKLAEVWSPSTGKWRVLQNVSSEPAAVYYAKNKAFRDNHYWVFAAANGWAFNAGPSPKMFWINTSGNGSLTQVGTRGDDTWSQSGTAVMYDVNKILKIGGAAGALNELANDNAYIIDISAGPGATPTITKLGAAPFPRAFHNSVVLPSGEVVTIGGQTLQAQFSDVRSVLMADIWSPATGKFRLLPPAAVGRNYHSWAVLMPDGRVASGGGGLCNCDGDHYEFQFLSPPYLFGADGKPAARPTITSAPTSASAGSTLSIATDRTVTSFALVRMGATTHTVNGDQRRVPLAVASSNGTTYRLNLPNEPGILLPGPWMLFAMDANGVPSVAKIVRVQ
ncbi:RICIN domain-containing protein [Methylobacterium sp. JK268]